MTRRSYDKNAPFGRGTQGTNIERDHPDCGAELRVLREPDSTHTGIHASIDSSMCLDCLVGPAARVQLAVEVVGWTG
jgi:hypothetical protein